MKMKLGALPPPLDGARTGREFAGGGVKGRGACGGKDREGCRVLLRRRV